MHQNLSEIEVASAIRFSPMGTLCLWDLAHRHHVLAPWVQIGETMIDLTPAEEREYLAAAKRVRKQLRTKLKLALNPIATPAKRPPAKHPAPANWAPRKEFGETK